MEVVNMDPDVMRFIDTVLCGDLNTPVTGQLALDLMVNPPKPGDPSCDMYTQVTHLQKILHRSSFPTPFVQVVPRAAPFLYRITTYNQSLLFFSSKEILLRRATLSQNAKRAQEFLNGLPGMSCQPVMGGIYLYPRLRLLSEITEQAKVGKYYNYFHQLTSTTLLCCTVCTYM